MISQYTNIIHNNLKFVSPTFLSFVPAKVFEHEYHSRTLSVCAEKGLRVRIVRSISMIVLELLVKMMQSVLIKSTVTGNHSFS